MSAFDIGPFDNDGALDLFDEIFESDNVTAICEDIFDAAISSMHLDDFDGESVSVCGAIVDSVINGTSYGSIAYALGVTP